MLNKIIVMCCFGMWVIMCYKLGGSVFVRVLFGLVDGIWCVCGN